LWLLEVFLPEGLMGVRRKYDGATLSTLVLKPEFHQIEMRNLWLAFTSRPLSERIPKRSAVGWTFGLLYAIAMSFLTLQYGLQFDAADPDDLSSIRAITGMAAKEDLDVTTAWLNANWRANLIDFVVNQPFSILSNFLLLYCFYKLQTTTAKYVAEADAEELKERVQSLDAWGDGSTSRAECDAVNIVTTLDPEGRVEHG
jgi:hypothetical protein